MRLLPWLVSWYLPLCATTGIAGITAPGVVDFAHQHFHYDKAVLVAPANFQPPPNIVSPIFNVPPAQLFAAVQEVAASQPRTYQLDVEPAQLQAAWVIRSAAINFPDIVEIAAIPAGPGKSTLILSSHAIYGWYDYGVNAKHARRWLHDLQLKVPK